MMSVTRMPVALSGPALLTVRVNVTLVPTAGVRLSIVLVNDRSAVEGAAPENSYAPTSQMKLAFPSPSRGRAVPR